MSFAQEVKKEVSIVEYTKEEAKAFLYGYIKLKGEVLIESKALKIRLASTSLSITRKIVTCIKDAYNIDVEIIKRSKSKLNKLTEYLIEIVEKASNILLDLGLSDDGYFLTDSLTDKHNEHIDKVIAGMFVARGSINDPNKLYYHLEIVTPDFATANFVVNGLMNFGITAHTILRTKGIVVYVKKSEDIGDFLKLIGTNQELFNFENARIKKDYNNFINRIVNCDMANGVRSQKTIEVQLNAIKKIEDKIGYAKLSERMMEGIMLRTKYPTHTLLELSDESEECVGHFIPKSTICHILKDIVALADSL